MPQVRAPFFALAFHEAQTSDLANRQAMQLGLQGPLVVRARELLEAPTDEVLDEHLDAARASGDAARVQAIKQRITDRSNHQPMTPHTRATNRSDAQLCFIGFRINRQVFGFAE
jgi:hypothetical protein